MISLIIVIIVVAAVTWSGYREFISRSRYKHIVRRIIEEQVNFQNGHPKTPSDQHLSILDFGSGNGKISRGLETMGKVTRLDIIDCPDCTSYVKYDGYTIPFQDGAFDIAIAVFCLHHIEHQEHALKELARVAKKIVVLEDSVSAQADTGSTRYRVSKWHFGFFGQTEHSIRLMKADKEWELFFGKMGMRVDYKEMVSAHPLYPVPHVAFVLSKN